MSNILIAEIWNFCHFCVQNEWKIVRRWHHQLTHLHIHTDWSRNVSWKFAKLQNFITSLFFNRFSSGFHCSVQKILLFLLKSAPDFPFKMRKECISYIWPIDLPSHAQVCNESWNTKLYLSGCWSYFDSILLAVIRIKPIIAFGLSNFSRSCRKKRFLLISLVAWKRTSKRIDTRTYYHVSSLARK